MEIDGIDIIDAIDIIGIIDAIGGIEWIGGGYRRKIERNIKGI